MDNSKIGNLIFLLRKSKNPTQKQLAELLFISDRTVSKWERGIGCPDISMIPQICEIFEIPIKTLLSGTFVPNTVQGDSMKTLKFYFCPICGNHITSHTETDISCCGKQLLPLSAQKADESHLLKIEPIENEFFITSSHPMQKEHFISFVAFLNGDTLIFKKQYPEWDLQSRLSFTGHGMLFWHCTKHGLFYQIV